MTTDINYTKTNFQYQAPTKITGKSNYALLKKKDKKELIANAASVTSNSGGAMHGHLGQVLNPVDYTVASLVPYVKPTHSGPLVYPAGIPNYQQQELQEDHKESVRAACEAENVEGPVQYNGLLPFYKLSIWV